MSIENLKAMVQDVPDAGIKMKRSEIKLSELICSSGQDFGVAKMADGRIACCWPGHIDVVNSKEEALELLNVHERSLFDNEVKQ